METIKTKDASERQINFIKSLLWKTQVKLVIDNDELNDLDFHTAKCLIKSLKTVRNHYLIHPDCRTKRTIDFEIMKQKSSKTKEPTEIQNALLKSLYKEGKITGEQYISVRNSQDAYELIFKFFENKEEKIMEKLENFELVKSKRLEGGISEEQKQMIKKRYIEDKVGVPTIARELNITPQRIMYWLKKENLMRTPEEYRNLGGLTKAREKSRIILGEMKERGELKRKKEILNPVEVVEKQVQGEIKIKINGLEISGNIGDIAELVKKLH